MVLQNSQCWIPEAMWGFSPRTLHLIDSSRLATDSIFQVLVFDQQANGNYPSLVVQSLTGILSDGGQGFKANSRVKFGTPRVNYYQTGSAVTTRHHFIIVRRSTVVNLVTTDPV